MGGDERGEGRREERIGERIGGKGGERGGVWENPLPRMLWESRGELEVGEDLVRWEEMRGEKGEERRG
jgi:hypothetical protein